MNRFKNHLIAAGLLSVLAIIGTIMNSHRVAAQGPPTGMSVNIVNPLPVPVTGTVGVTGTQNVNVANPATAPVLFLNVNDPGRIPYQKVISAKGPFLTFPAVPSGHRLVLQHVSINLSIGNALATTQAVGVVYNNIVVPEMLVSMFPLAVQLLEGGIAQAFVDQPILGYVDAGSAPIVGEGVESGIVGNMVAVLTGYMLDCTVAPCAAIAP